jgi:catechol 2,3-dioxygenase-like lactoylglutathione lyase family enzyme
MKGIEIIMLPVKDRKASKAFYNKIGFKTLVESTDPHGSPWIQVGFDMDSTTLSLAGFHGIICATDDIEKEVEQIRDSGIEVGQIDVTPYGKFAWLKDPDGNGICLREAPKQA